MLAGQLVGRLHRSAKNIAAMSEAAVPRDAQAWLCPRLPEASTNLETPRRILQGQTQVSVRAIAVTPDGNAAFLAAATGRCRVWNRLPAGRLEHHRANPTRRGDGDRRDRRRPTIVCFGGDGTVRVEPGQRPPRAHHRSPHRRGGGEAVTAMANGPSPVPAATGSVGRDLASGRLERTRRRHTRGMTRGGDPQRPTHHPGRPRRVAKSGTCHGGQHRAHGSREK